MRQRAANKESQTARGVRADAPGAHHSIPREGKCYPHSISASGGRRY
jgi:hypothetical protein